VTEQALTKTHFRNGTLASEDANKQVSHVQRNQSLRALVIGLISEGDNW